jgi:hypothetical protein
MQAQNLDYNSKIELALNNGTLVVLYAQLEGSGAAMRAGKNYYYLPSAVQLAADPVSKEPQFLFLKYVTEQREDNGGVSGALMHFLMQTGFTKQQLDELQAKLVAKVAGARLAGPVDLFSTGEANSFNITSAVVNTSSGMTKSLVTSGKAPLQQGGRVAVAANLDKNGAQLLANTFEGKTAITDLSVNLFYKYYLKVNGIKAKFTIDYTKMEEVTKRDRISGKYTEDNHWFSQDEQTQTWTEIHKVYEHMIEEKAITIEIEQNFPNGTADKLTEMLFQLFLTLVATPSTDKPPPAEPATTEPYLPGRNTAYEYKLRIYKNSKVEKKKKDVVTLNYNFLMPMELTITQNMKTFYDAAKLNKNSIRSVVLGDPFYKHMDILFVLDLDAKEIFDQEINYVTASVRRKSAAVPGGYRDLGNVKFTKDIIAAKGITAELVYPSEAEENNRELYEYKVQWSLRGGNLFPANPAWQKGSMTALQLAPPVMPRVVEFEADLDKLKSIGITRITLQVRYKKNEQEMEENLNISPAAGQALVNKMIFVDRDTRGYAYRLIFNHKDAGKLALPWSARVSDNYVYATIPDELADMTSEVFVNAADAGKTIVPATPDGKVTTDKVLDQFKDILAVPKTN